MGNTLCRRFCDVPSIDPFESGIGSVNSASILLWFMTVKHHEGNRKISKKLKLRLTSACNQVDNQSQFNAALA